jgi:predicted NUDIX family NTP pyrophosphohydrolase
MPKKKSAGILMYRRDGGVLRVLLVHPGGPFWAKRDAGAWSIRRANMATAKMRSPSPGANSPRSLGRNRLTAFAR